MYWMPKLLSDFIEGVGVVDSCLKLVYSRSKKYKKYIKCKYIFSKILINIIKTNFCLLLYIKTMNFKKHYNSITRIGLFMILCFCVGSSSYYGKSDICSYSAINIWGILINQIKCFFSFSLVGGIIIILLALMWYFSWSFIFFIVYIISKIREIPNKHKLNDIENSILLKKDIEPDNE